MNGLIYVQRISDPRFGDESNTNLDMFRRLCGSKAYKNVVVLTTFWDRVAKVEGPRREAQLKSDFFKDLVVGGATFMRHNRTPESAQQVLRHIFTLVPTNVGITKKNREEGNHLEDTNAGLVRRAEVEAIIAKEFAGLKVGNKGGRPERGTKNESR